MKIRSAGLSLLKALVSRLQADLAHPVYSRAPKNSAYPYVTVGETQEDDWTTGNSSGTEIVADVQAFSRYFGSEEIETMRGEIIESVTRVPLDLTGDGFHLLRIFLDFSDTIQAQDGRTWIATVKFRSLIDDLTD